MAEMLWSTAYISGWKASKRADDNGASYEDDKAMDKALVRFVTRNGHYGDDYATGAFVTGWNDQAVGNDYDTEMH
jgi:hypothetical protein